MFVYTEYMKKKVFELLRLAAATPARRNHGRQKVSIPKCDLTGRRVMVNRSSSVPVRSVYTMFSMLFFMSRDPGDATSKVSCCVEPSLF